MALPPAAASRRGVEREVNLRVQRPRSLILLALRWLTLSLTLQVRRAALHRLTPAATFAMRRFVAAFVRTWARVASLQTRRVCSYSPYPALPHTTSPTRSSPPAHAGGYFRNTASRSRVRENVVTCGESASLAGVFVSVPSPLSLTLQARRAVLHRLTPAGTFDALGEAPLE